MTTEIDSSRTCLLELTEEEKPLVIYDMDCILWPFECKLAATMGVDLGQWTHYYAFGNPNFTPEQQAIAARCFRDPEFYRDIEFFPGVGNILQVEKLGAKVRIQTNSMTQEISDLKPAQLMRAIPGLRSEQIICTTTDSVQDVPKKISERTLILIDDNPHTIADSPAQVNVTRRIPWNTSREGVRLMTGKKVIWRNTLEEINDYVYAYVQKHIMALARERAKRHSAARQEFVAWQREANFMTTVGSMRMGWR